MAETNEAYKGDAYCVKCKAKRDFEGMVHISDSGGIGEKDLQIHPV
jgi:hypothetical protein